MLSRILNFFFPTECLACDIQGPDICTTCLETIHPPKEQNYEWITSYGNYHDKKLEKIMRHIKSQPNGRAAYLLAKSFGKMILNRPEDPQAWVLVPIPISRQRFRERGYNQCELLANYFGKVFKLRVMTDLLVKKRHTRKQGTSKSKSERATNIVDSFGIKKKYQGFLVNKNIVLLDDITTTGSTLVEVRTLLINAGTQKVFAWTIAN